MNALLRALTPNAARQEPVGDVPDPLNNPQIDTLTIHSSNRNASNNNDDDSAIEDVTPPEASGPTSRISFQTPNSRSPRTSIPYSPTVDDMTKPIMGDVVDGTSFVWVGGKPNYYWTGLDHSVPTSVPPPHQHRYSKDSKSYDIRSRGYVTPFNEKSNIRVLCDEVFSHFRTFGLDTITYLPDPASPLFMESVVQKPNLFTKDYVLTQIDSYARKYDSYDRSNQAAANLYLLNSLDPELKRRVKLTLSTTTTETFLVTWMTVIEMMRSLSVDRVSNLATLVEKRKPSGYAGHNLEKMAEENLADIIDLEQAGWFSLSTSNKMVRNFCSANPDCHEFRFFANDILNRYKHALQDCFHKHPDEKEAYMRRIGLSMEDVCRLFSRYYRAANQDGTWLPTRNVRDNNAVPNTLANNATKGKKAYNLIANGTSNSTVPPGKCHNCDQVGHWARDCPQPPKSKGRPTKAPATSTSWTRTPPAPGSSETKQMHGKSFHWCLTCKRWTTTHGTAQHRSKPDGSSVTTVKTANTATTTVPTVSSYCMWNMQICPPKKKNGSMLPDVVTMIMSVLFMFGIVGSSCIAVSIQPVLLQVLDILGWGIIAPISWLVSFGLFLFLKWYLPQHAVPVASPPKQTFTRSQKRAFAKLLRRELPDSMSEENRRRKYRNQRKKSKPFHRSYPLRLRNQGRYIRRTPQALNFVRQTNATRSYIRAIPSSHMVQALPSLRPRKDMFCCGLPQPKYLCHFCRRYQWLGAPVAMNCPTCKNLTNAMKDPAQCKCEACINAYVNKRLTPGLQSISRRTVEAARRNADDARRNTLNSRGPAFRSNKHSEGKRVPPSNFAKPKPITTASPTPPMYHQMNEPMSHQAKCAVRNVQKCVRMYSPNRTQYQAQPVFIQRPQQPSPPVNLNNIRINVALHPPVNPSLRATLLKFSPTWFRSFGATASKAATTRTVIWDSGASMSISPSKDDFVGELEMLSVRPTIKGISENEVEIYGQGFVSWTFEDTTGMFRTLKVPCLYVPDVRQRLLSTSSLLSTYPNETIAIGNGRLTLSGEPNTHGCGAIEAYIDPNNNLPTSDMFEHTYSHQLVDKFEAMTTVVANENLNLTEPEKELLRWHQRLAHIDFNKIKFLFRTGILARSEASRALQTAASKLKHHPRCAACQFGKQCQNSVPSTSTSRVSDSVGALSRNCTRPGQLISVDHFVCKTHGRLFTSRGRTTPSEMYSGGCVFVDNYSGYIHVEMQKHLNTHETLDAKSKFEAFALDHGVIPQSYLSDNGPAFASHEYERKLKEFEQVTKFAGAGAHHHNGVAERSIRTVISIARTMMMHAAIHWPEMSDPILWPMAVKYAAHVYNRMPATETGLCPFDVFASQRWKQTQLHDMHVWGSPVYVLEKGIADGMKIPKWAPRSKRFIYMGVSEKHSSTVPVVLNPETGVISPQFHVVIDEWFATVGTAATQVPDFNGEQWTKMFGESRYQYMWDEETDRNDATIEDENFGIVQRRNNRIEGAMDHYLPPIPLPVADPPTTTNHQHPHAPNSNRFEPLADDDDDDTTTTTPPPSAPRRPPPPIQIPPSREQPLIAPPSVAYHPPTPTAPPTEDFMFPMADIPDNVPPDTLRRSQRTRKAPDRLNLYTESPFCFNIVNEPYGLHQQSDATLTYLTDALMATTPNKVSASSLVSADAFKAAIGDPDTLTWDEAMSDKEHADEWRAAALKEITALEKHETWAIDDFENATTKVLPGTWVFRRKRLPDGTIHKYKARYCVRGDLQEEQNETFAPVVHWSTIRLTLILSMLLNWTVDSIDFSQAFVQATLAEPVWIHLPRGFHPPETTSKKCLKLLKSLYGLSEAPRLWYLHLFNALINDLGFTQSILDPCCLLKPNMMICIFVDDCAISYKHKKDYDQLIADLRRLNFELTEEGPFTKFLGINFTRGNDNTITMTQEGLIKQIAEATGLSNANPNHTPTTQEAIGKDPHGLAMKEDWSYRSIIGMLLYLSTNTRPDIAFAVSQAARFCHDPKQSHATAVKTIVRYLIGTKDKGTVVTPTGKLDIKLYVDADFAGLFKKEENDDPNSARSRTGYILLLGGFPLIWKSHLQTEISLSTLESEYSALSSATRALIPIRELLFEISDTVELPSELLTTITSTIFEDNQGAYLLGNSQHITARTRYFLVKYHHFWEYIRMEEANKRKMWLEKIATQLQGADFLTKGLPRIVFVNNRKNILGW